MLPGLSPTVQALLATCFTWFVTALGAALVFLVSHIGFQGEITLQRGRGWGC
jgi:zinc transporter ZupT